VAQYEEVGGRHGLGWPAGLAACHRRPLDQRAPHGCRWQGRRVPAYMGSFWMKSSSLACSKEALTSTLGARDFGRLEKPCHMKPGSCLGDCRNPVH
jgi:hypothetical protein